MIGVRKSVEVVAATDVGSYVVRSPRRVAVCLLASWSSFARLVKMFVAIVVFVNKIQRFLNDAQ